MEQDEISSLIPLKPKELDNPMGATPTKPKVVDDLPEEVDHTYEILEKDLSMYKLLKNSIEGNSRYSYGEKKAQIEQLDKIYKQLKEMKPVTDLFEMHKRDKQTQHSQEEQPKGKKI